MAVFSSRTPQYSTSLSIPERSYEQLARILSFSARSIKSLELKMDNISRFGWLVSL